MKYFLVILLFVSTVLAGDPDRISTEKMVFTQGINIDSYNSLGFSGIVSVPASEISSANPASLANFSGFAAGVRFTYATQIDYMYSSKLERPKQWLPASVGVIYSFGNLSTGLAYQQKYSCTLHFPLIPISEGQMLSVIQESLVHSPSAILSGSFSGILADHDKLSLGLQIYWDFWEENGKMNNHIFRLDGNKINLKTGIIYQANEKLGIGMVFTKHTDIVATFNVNRLINNSIPDSGQVYFRSVRVNIPHIKFPDILSFGFTSKLTNNLHFSITLSSIFWNSLDKNYKNQVDISLSSVYEFLNRGGVSLSLYKADRNISYGSSIENNVTFLGAGIKTGWKNFDGRIEVLDSHFFSSEYQKQTRIRAALDCYL